MNQKRLIIHVSSLSDLIAPRTVTSGNRSTHQEIGVWKMINFDKKGTSSLPRRRLALDKMYFMLQTHCQQPRHSGLTENISFRVPLLKKAKEIYDMN